ncbi:MAG: MoaD/ThiS family protein [Myxococcota bacterium]
MPRVELTRHLHRFFPQLHGTEIAVSGDTVAQVVEELNHIAPGVLFYLCDEQGRLRQHVNIFINNERIRDRRNLSDPVEPDTCVYILQALSGG